MLDGRGAQTFEKLLHERQLRRRNDCELLVTWVRLALCAASKEPQRRSAGARGALATLICEQTDSALLWRVEARLTRSTRSGTAQQSAKMVGVQSRVRGWRTKSGGRIVCLNLGGCRRDERRARGYLDIKVPSGGQVGV